MKDIDKLLIIVIGSMTTLTAFATALVVRDVYPPLAVWVVLWFVILWHYPETRWWKKKDHELKSGDWFSMATTAIAIICLEYIALLLMVEFVFPVFQAILDSILDLFYRSRVPW